MQYIVLGKKYTLWLFKEIVLLLFIIFQSLGCESQLDLVRKNVTTNIETAKSEQLFCSNISTKSEERLLSPTHLLILQINQPLPVPSLTYLKCVPEARLALVPLPVEPSLS